NTGNSLPFPECLNIFHSYTLFLNLFPQAANQTDMPACPFDGCREGHCNMVSCTVTSSSWYPSLSGRWHTTWIFCPLEHFKRIDRTSFRFVTCCPLMDVIISPG